MKNSFFTHFITGFALGVLVLAPVQTAHAEPVIVPPITHTFSIDDLQGGFDGSTFGTAGAVQDTSIICGGPGTGNCDVNPMTDTKIIGEPVTLYPVDTDFGYYVVDFLGAQGKTRDGLYEEGFIGNVDGGGVAISNAATDTYKVKPPMGTWCRGLGGLSVKCETEHYSVMEHAISCHEVIPYFFADEDTGAQQVQMLPDGSASFDCAEAGLDDYLEVLVGGAPTSRLIDSTPCEDVNDPEGCQMFPNDKTDMQNNIALGSDYAVQLKDDGKALYGWGGMHKRPNDMRLYARMMLPAAWKLPGADFAITRAELVVEHHVTNNPNDQLRPEDLENEAATGRKPSYVVEATADGDVWKSTINCFEGDSDYIGIDEGAGDPNPIEAGTVFKNPKFAFEDYSAIHDLYAFSEDLREGLTNAWYTTIGRDPFEWSYDADPADTLQDFVGFRSRDEAELAGYTDDDLVSGPRWRLTANKYGQDLPGLEIAIDPEPGQGTDGADCYAPPFAKELIKYNVGDPITTTINLLDWDESEGPSPLATTRGWVDVFSNHALEIDPDNCMEDPMDPDSQLCVSGNGLPMTNDFDLAIYVKGDRKATVVYTATLNVGYDDTPIPVEVDVPDVVGELQAAADVILTNAGLIMSVTGTACSDLYPGIGTVLTQDPLAGTTVASGTTVDVTTSEGPCAGETVPVPDIGVCPTVDTATAAITGAGLTVNPVNDEEASDVCAAGTVIRTSPPAGTEVVIGNEVTLVVSTGPADLSDVTIDIFRVPTAIDRNSIGNLIVRIVNATGAEASGPVTVTLSGSDGSLFSASYPSLGPGDAERDLFRWTSPRESQTVEWSLSVTASGEIVDTATASTRVR